MATKSKSVAAATAAPTGTSIANIDQQLALEVGNLRNMISAPSGNKIKIEASGDFVLPDGSNLGNEIQVVVVDFMSRNFFYSTAYNPNSISPPDCYAMGRDKSTMAPENDSPDAQSDSCGTCPLNAFGSGNGGKSKACQNRYWLSVLVVDPEDPDAHNAPDAPLYLLDISPSNLRSFDAYATNVSRMLAGPPIKSIATVIGKNVGTYASVTFCDPLPNPDYASHFARRGEASAALERRPDFTAAEAAKPPPRRGTTQPARRAAGTR